MKGSPTPQEITEAEHLIRQSLGNKSVEKAVQMMYDSLIRKKPLQKVFCDYIHPLSHIPKAPKHYQYHPKGRSEVIVNFSKGSYQHKQFVTQIDEKRFFLRRIVAKSFIKYGIGHDEAQEELLKSKNNAIFASKLSQVESLSKIYYQTLVNEVFAEAVENVQEFLTQACSLKLKRLGKEHLYEMRQIIESGKIAESLSILKTFMKLHFQLASVTISENEAVCLYLDIIKAFYGKKITVQGLEMMTQQVDMVSSPKGK